MSYDERTLRRHLDSALRDGDPGPLESFLLDNHDDPAVSDTVAHAIAALVTSPDAPVDRIEALLDGWAALDPTTVPRDDPRARLPATALRTYGEVTAPPPGNASVSPPLRVSASPVPSPSGPLTDPPTRPPAHFLHYRAVGNAPASQPCTSLSGGMSGRAVCSSDSSAQQIERNEQREVSNR